MLTFWWQMRVGSRWVMSGDYIVMTKVITISGDDDSWLHFMIMFSLRRRRFFWKFCHQILARPLKCHQSSFVIPFRTQLKAACKLWFVIKLCLELAQDAHTLVSVAMSSRRCNISWLLFDYWSKCPGENESSSICVHRSIIEGIPVIPNEELEAFLGE